MALWGWDFPYLTPTRTQQEFPYLGWVDVPIATATGTGTIASQGTQAAGKPPRLFHGLAVLSLLSTVTSIHAGIYWKYTRRYQSLR